MKGKWTKIAKDAFKLTYKAWLILLLFVIGDGIDLWSYRGIVCLVLLPLALGFLASWCRYREDEKWEREKNERR